MTTGLLIAAAVVVLFLLTQKGFAAAPAAPKWTGPPSAVDFGSSPDLPPKTLPSPKATSGGSVSAWVGKQTAAGCSSLAKAGGVPPGLSNAACGAVAGTAVKVASAAAKGVENAGKKVLKSLKFW